jgi:hypothetical protein
MNIWRYAQDDLKLCDYSIENVSLVQLRAQIPKFKNITLSGMPLSGVIAYLN